MIAWAAVAVLACGCAGADPPRAPHPPPARDTMNPPGYPNVHARLRVEQRASSTPPRSAEMEIWLHGRRFHIRDHGGRPPYEIIQDVVSPRQLGMPARTIEEIMDRHTEALEPRRDPPPTDLYGDLDSGDGRVYPSGRRPWAKPAGEMAAVAEQILADRKTLGLDVGTSSTRLGRTATEYRGTVTVTEDGAQFENHVIRVISPPYLLFEDTRNAANAEMSYVREVIALDEGSVTDADVTPPVP
jgi:hypothetical protein